MIGIGVGIGRQRFASGGAPSVPTFEFTIDTANTGISTSTQFKLPLTTSTGLDCVVDWGDGNTDNITNHLAPEVTHTYASSGTYTVKITGDLLGWRFGNGGDRFKILNIAQWGALNISVDGGFFGCTNLTCSATDTPIITSTSLQSYFRTCQNFNGAIGNWNTSNVTSMEGMLRQASSFNQDISNWDINQVSTFVSFMLSATGLSTTNYDLLLVGWEAQAPISGLSVNFGGSKYTLLSAAATARASLIATYGWTITDGGGI
jgi:surface protein